MSSQTKRADIKYVTTIIYTELTLKYLKLKYLIKFD